MNKRLIALAFSLGLMGGTSLWAHHSLAAEYDQKKPVSLTGTLTKLDWRNPHAWIYMDVKNSSGGIDKWECELGSPNAMTRAGFTQDSVKLGEEIVLDGRVPVPCVDTDLTLDEIYRRVDLPAVGEPDEVEYEP